MTNKELTTIEKHIATVMCSVLRVRDRLFLDNVNYPVSKEMETLFETLVHNFSPDVESDEDFKPYFQHFNTMAVKLSVFRSVLNKTAPDVQGEELDLMLNELSEPSFKEAI